MKYIRLFKENLTYKSEEEYKSIIENCILYLIDSYPYEYFRTDDEEKPLYSYYFNIKYDSDIDELCDLIDSSYHKLINELNPKIEFALALNDRDDYMIFGTDSESVGGISLDKIKEFIHSKTFQLHYGCSLELTLIIS